LQADGETAIADNFLFVMTSASESITFVNVQEEPVPSILRGFSAPVVLDFDYTDAQLLTLLAFDTDPFNRWEAGQRLGLRSAIKSIAGDANSTGAKPAE
jgi:aminopeptidase N